MRTFITISLSGWRLHYQVSSWSGYRDHYPLRNNRVWVKYEQLTPTRWVMGTSLCLAQATIALNVERVGSENDRERFFSLRKPVQSMFLYWRGGDWVSSDYMIAVIATAKPSRKKSLRGLAGRKNHLTLSVLHYLSSIRETKDHYYWTESFSLRDVFIARATNEKRIIALWGARSEGGKQDVGMLV